MKPPRVVERCLRWMPVVLRCLVQSLSWVMQPRTVRLRPRGTVQRRATGQAVLLQGVSSWPASWQLALQQSALQQLASQQSASQQLAS